MHWPVVATKRFIANLLRLVLSRDRDASSNFHGWSAEPQLLVWIRTRYGRRSKITASLRESRETFVVGKRMSLAGRRQSSSTASSILARDFGSLHPFVPTRFGDVAGSAA
jgi:hypothetical protein